jgi:flavin reductase (DIM6/NTAB) family NADH-FMN oxidoreductase RutF
MSAAPMQTDTRAAFRRACAEFATGVTAVTARSPAGEVAALTANSFTSVSLDPPIVLLCIGRKVSSLEVLEASTHLAIHVLGASHEEVARRLATRGLTGAERLAGVTWRSGRYGEPVIDSCAARFSGPILDRIEAGDHLVYLVAAEDVALVEPAPPTLVFHRGRFAPSAPFGPEDVA